MIFINVYVIECLALLKRQKETVVNKAGKFQT